MNILVTMMIPLYILWSFTIFREGWCRVFDIIGGKWVREDEG